LGKTIEAVLVMANAGRSEKPILLVAPASLRKQWAQELEDKFELPSLILNGEVAKVAIRVRRENFPTLWKLQLSNNFLFRRPFS
jgi:SNF2 family DNA or RNA helicase